MPEEKKSFTHIVVNDADDDIVIQAGSSSAPCDGVAASRQDEPPAPTAPRPSSKPGDGEAGTAAEPQPSGANRGPSGKRQAKEGYRETTLEDLESPSMSTMQKVIIALCVVGVAVAVVYCAFFMS